MARAVKLEVLDRHPEAELELFLMWSNVIGSDDEEGARRAATLVDDSRVTQFYDTKRVFGRHMAPWHGMQPMRAAVEASGQDPEELVGRFKRDYVFGPAAIFDTVYFYPTGVRWGDKPLAPQAWATQLDPYSYLGLDKKRFFFGDGMSLELRKLGDRLLAASAESEGSK